MSSCQIFKNESHQASGSSFTQRGCSKAQRCLLKILHVITTLPPDNTLNPQYSSAELQGSDSDVGYKSKGFNIDLNVGFFAPPGSAESESPIDDGCLGKISTAVGTSGTDEKCQLYSGGASILTIEGPEEDEGEEEEGKLCISESSGGEGNGNWVNIGITEVEIAEHEQKSEVVEPNSEMGKVVNAHEKQEREGEIGCLDMLIEAAKLILGNSEVGCSLGESKAAIEVGESPTRILKRRKTPCWAEELYGSTEEPEPEPPVAMVRSKRGRTQVLPYKYRDSVLEPLTRLSRNRSTAVAHRRRSR